MTFLHSLPGIYVTQAIVHSFIALVIVEISFFVWGIKDHLSKFRYRILTLTLPAFMFPLYQFIFPERGTWHFRLNTALFDSMKWIDIKIEGIYPFGLIFILFLAGVTCIFFMQEILPLIRNRSLREEFSEGVEQTEADRRKIKEIGDRIFAGLSIGKPSVAIIDEEAPVLFTRGVKNHTVFISRRLLDTLNEEQLKGALTHEAVHMLRGSSIKTQGIYLARMLMFYNPVSLVEFRRIVHDDEFICDAVTVSKTGNPGALIEALSAFYHKPDGEDNSARTDGLSGMKERIEMHSHNLMLDERIAVLKEMSAPEEKPFSLFQFSLTAAAILSAGYLVV